MRMPYYLRDLQRGPNLESYPIRCYSFRLLNIDRYAPRQYPNILKYEAPKPSTLEKLEFDKWVVVKIMVPFGVP